MQGMAIQAVVTGSHQLDSVIQSTVMVAKRSIDTLTLSPIPHIYRLVCHQRSNESQILMKYLPTTLTLQVEI